MRTFLRGRAIGSRKGALWLACAALAGGCLTKKPPENHFYDQHVQPILKSFCVGNTSPCHAVDPATGTALGNLDLTSFEGIQKRRDVLRTYGSYPHPLLLLKAVPEDAVMVNYLGDPSCTTCPTQYPSEIRHAGGKPIAANSDAFFELKRWLENGANRDGVSALIVGARGAQQIDLSTGQQEFFDYSHAPQELAPSYKHNHIFVATPSGIDLLYLNLGGRTPYTIPLDGPAGAMSMNGSGTRIYTAIRGKNVIDVVDTEQYAVVQRISIDSEATAIAVSPREEALYVGTANGVLAIDLGNENIRSRTAFLGSVVDIAIIMRVTSSVHRLTSGCSEKRRHAPTSVSSMIAR